MGWSTAVVKHWSGIPCVQNIAFRRPPPPRFGVKVVTASLGADHDAIEVPNGDTENQQHVQWVDSCCEK